MEHHKYRPKAQKQQEMALILKEDCSGRTAARPDSRVPSTFSPKAEHPVIMAEVAPSGCREQDTPVRHFSPRRSTLSGQVPYRRLVPPQ